MKDAIAELDKLLGEAGLQVKFGLRQQGHLPTIKRMLEECKSWEEIGRAISWDPTTAEEWYHDEQLMEMVRDKMLEEYGVGIKIDWDTRQFGSFQQWVNKASTWIDSRAICVDTEGYICQIGEHFMAARDAGRFPIRFGWPRKPPKE